jgi:Tol biopolymer transport system component
MRGVFYGRNMKLERFSTILILILAACTQRNTPEAMLTKYPPSPVLTSIPLPTATIVFIPPPEPTETPDVLLLSPDGTKKIQSFDRNNYEILNSDGTTLWLYSYDNKFRVLEPAADPFHWSKDGKYIYITCYHNPDDSSTKYWGNGFYDGDCVFRFDVEMGTLKTIIPEIRPGYYAFSISPDDSKLVYANQSETPVKIKLLDLQTNTENVLYTASKNILDVGSFGWSPQMDKLIFTTMRMDDQEKRFYTIFVLDLKSLKTKAIVEDFNEYLNFVSWDNSGKILYKGWNYEKGYAEVEMWKLNLESRKVSPAITPMP